MSRLICSQELFKAGLYLIIPRLLYFTVLTLHFYYYGEFVFTSIELYCAEVGTFF